MKILIADDEHYVRLELVALLNELLSSAVIDEVENGSQLKKILSERDYHIAFIDIKMPGQSGLEVLREFKDLHKKTILIILSGYSDFDYARSAISLGVSEYLLKPVTKEQLVPLLKKLTPSLQVLAPPDGTSVNTLIRNAEKLIYRHYKEQIGVAQIAEKLNVSPNYLSSQFKKYKNISLTGYITDLRMKAATEMLILPGANVKNISENLGYQSSRHFSRLFREKFGITPSEYMNKKHIVEFDPFL